MSIAISRFVNDVVKKKKLVEYRQDKLNQDDLQKVTSCQDILYYLKWDMQEKEIDQKQKRNLLSKVFNLFEIFEITEQEFLLDCLFSARTFIYWNYLFEKGKTKIFLSRHILSLTPYPRPVYMIKEALWVWLDGMDGIGIL